MAARGLSSKTIAERLVISVRTINNTLHQVYGKLAVSNRASISGPCWRDQNPLPIAPRRHPSSA